MAKTDDKKSRLSDAEKLKALKKKLKKLKAALKETAAGLEARAEAAVAAAVKPKNPVSPLAP
ncbi:bifunctional ornithine acetyltransferase/N-acetylglutamate synthase, partial [Paracoccus sp. PXZ]